MSAAASATIRRLAVAGAFYPAEPQVLRAALARHLASAGPPELAGMPVDPAPAGLLPPKLLVVPHAGYRYSGDVAARAYAPLARWRSRITRVLLLGPVHHVPVRGLAAPLVAAFATPLGLVLVDRAALDRLRALPQLVWSDLPQAQEHALEVQLPFLQTVLGTGFTLVPLAVGQASPQAVAEVLEQLWGGAETLIVISTDLSHFLPDAQARARDSATAERILRCATDLDPQDACGAAPLNGALLAARRHGLLPRLLALRNAADAAQYAGWPDVNRQRVVGYGAFAFGVPTAARQASAGAAEAAVGAGGHADAGPADPGAGAADAADPADPDDIALGRALLVLARRAIADGLGLRPPQTTATDAPSGVLPHRPDPPALQRPGASFVTLLDADGPLRGCIRQLEAVRVLGEDVRANARAAAFGDSRFAPLVAAEWSGLRVEVSLLGQAEPLLAASEAAALALLRPGVDGVILAWRGRRATLLPQVWQQLPEPADFLAALRRKAGLPPGFWSAELRLSRYRVHSFSAPASAGLPDAPPDPPAATRAVAPEAAR